MRYWFLTNTTYATWLPGDPRGSITSVRDHREDDAPSLSRIEHKMPGEEWEDSIPSLYRSARQSMKGPAIYLDENKAERLLVQFQETASYRGWKLHAVAIMANHIHIVVEVDVDPEPGKVLADFKAYGSRILNCEYGKPESETWWTENGSKRKLKDDEAVVAAIYYVLYKQPNPLVVWSPEHGRII